MTKDRSTENPEDEPKLIIDEDWKSQVEREKKNLKKQKPAEGEQSDQALDSTSQPVHPHTSEDLANEDMPTENAEGSKSGRSPQTLPPASFEYLVSGMATQALMALGQFPDEEDDQSVQVDLDFARHYIDLLGVLETKTQGNLTEHEQRFLRDALHQLRLLFVSVMQD